MRQSTPIRSGSGFASVVRVGASTAGRVIHVSAPGPTPRPAEHTIDGLAEERVGARCAVARHEEPVVDS